MKKIISLILSLIMITGMILPVASAKAAETTYDGNPVIVVRGIAFASLVKADGTLALQFDKNAIISLLFDGLLARFALQDKEAFGDTFCEIAYDIFEPISCDNEGNSKYDISMRQFKSSMANYTSYVKSLDGTAEHGLLKEAVDRYGAEKVYYFTYDWRKSPRELAAELNSLVETAKKDNRADKVDIICASMGCMVTTAYFYYCGSDSVNSAVYVSGAHNGTYSFGNAINGDIVFDKDVVLDYVYSLIEGDLFTYLLLKVFDGLGAVDFIIDFANDFVSSNFDKANDRVFRPCFGTLPGFWSLCPDDCFESGIDTIFAGHESEYPVLLEKLDDTKNFVMSTEETLQGIMDNGVKLTFISNYNGGLAPVYKNADMQGDRVLETALTSNFATVAKQGRTLTAEQLEGVAAEFISADKIINASTAVFPEITWFVKDADHVATDYGSQYSDFVFTLLESETQPDVNTFSSYPRFMIETGTGDLQTLK